MTLAAGAIAALLAIVIATLPTLLVLAFPLDPAPQIQATALFPKPSPIQKVIDVYDPPPPAPRPVYRPTPSSQPTSRPSPSPEPSDGQDN